MTMEKIQLEVESVLKRHVASLYIHVPFCAQLCHYCDFAKTANFSDLTKDQYFLRVLEDLRLWHSALGREFAGWNTVFLGGGTPGIFADEYVDIFALIKPLLKPNSEVSIEANPNNLTKSKISIWSELGINRVSLGVQTLDAAGLKILTRDHSVDSVHTAIELLANANYNFNIDLIYGWPGQSLETFAHDLAVCVERGVPHLSLYTLTFEPRTALGRKYHRGALTNLVNEELIVEMYTHACEFLASKGYVHEEISNWSLPGFSCAHNWVYWNFEPYVGIGTGAHGFVPSQLFERVSRVDHAMHDPDSGIRWSETSGLQGYLRNAPMSQIEIDARSKSDALMEYITTGLRCTRGVDVDEIKKFWQLDFVPTLTFQMGLEKSLMAHQGSKIFLTEAEWFREHSWTLEVCASFQGPNI